MSNSDIFAELNDVLSKPNLGRSDEVQISHGDLGNDPTRPDPMLVKQLGFQAARLLNDCSRVGPLAPPTRARDHRFRAELSLLFNPAVQSDTGGGQ